MFKLDLLLESIKEENLEFENMLLNAGGSLPTEFSFYGSEDYFGRVKPGFFTPFNNKDDKTGVKQAAITLGLAPAQLLCTALIAPLSMAAGVFLSCSKGDWYTAIETTMNLLFLIPIVSTCLLGAAVFNLCKELTALLTRSIATLVDLCQTPNNLTSLGEEGGGYGRLDYY